LFIRSYMTIEIEGMASCASFRARQSVHCVPKIAMYWEFQVKEHLHPGNERFWKFLGIKLLTLMRGVDAEYSYEEDARPPATDPGSRLLLMRNDYLLRLPD